MDKSVKITKAEARVETQRFFCESLWMDGSGISHYRPYRPVDCY